MTRRQPWYRDRARLTAAVAEHGSVQAAAAAFDTPRATVAHWARIHGVRSGHPKTPGALELTARREATGHTYLVGAEGQGLVKIGRTSGAPRARMATMQTGSPVRLHLLATLPHPRWEDVLHQHYAHLRRNGEWFALTVDQLATVMRWACEAAFPDVAATVWCSSWPTAAQASAAGWDPTVASIAAVFVD